MAERTEIRFPSGDAECAAWLYLPEGTGRAPVVVMGHGLGAVREMRLDAYAERFVAAGYACLVFDYRHFGASGGEPRQLLSVSHQLEDWKAAIACAQGRPELDGDRVVLWGSSFGGGHVIATAAEVPVAAAIVQCPYTDGLASALAVPPRTTARLLPLAIRDVIAARRGGPPVMVKLAGEPGEVALMSAPDVMPGFSALVPEGFELHNEVAARIGLEILRYRPGRRAPRVTCPLHVTVCGKDSVAPARSATRYLNKAPRAEVVHRPIGHFEVYTQEFEGVVADQVAFLLRHVPAVAAA
jgi:dienelactone hydrolase